MSLWKLLLKKKVTLNFFRLLLWQLAAPKRVYMLIFIVWLVKLRKIRLIQSNFIFSTALTVTFIIKIKHSTKSIAIFSLSFCVLSKTIKLWMKQLIESSAMTKIEREIFLSRINSHSFMPTESYQCLGLFFWVIWFKIVFMLTSTSLDISVTYL